MLYFHLANSWFELLCSSSMGKRIKLDFFQWAEIFLFSTNPERDMEQHIEKWNVVPVISGSYCSLVLLKTSVYLSKLRILNIRISLTVANINIVIYATFMEK